jgi:hypothetical protein
MKRVHSQFETDLVLVPKFVANMRNSPLVTRRSDQGGFFKSKKLLGLEPEGDAQVRWFGPLLKARVGPNLHHTSSTRLINEFCRAYPKGGLL